jgi:glycine betaine catabolism B
MYDVVVHALLLIYGAAFMSAVIGWLPYTPLSLAASLVVALFVAVVSNRICSYVCQVPAQSVSAIISALIIVLICSPITVASDALLIAVMTMLAIASKYVLVWKRQHLLNPVAIGAVGAAWLGFGGATWWVATPLLVGVVVIAGSLVVTKIRRWPMIGSFLVVGYGVYVFESWFGSAITVDTWLLFWLSYPMLFLAAFMLTEPFTTPGTKRLQLFYGAVVGVVANTSVFNGITFMTPELALVVGNVLFYPWSLRQKLVLTLKEVHTVAPRVYEFVFNKPATMRYQAGQYLEWMWPHTTVDSRGSRRYFTIVSAPEDDTIAVAMKVPETASSFKRTLSTAPIDATVYASQLAGDFVLPDTVQEKIGWIAGGIGVTPFVSQARSIQNRHEERDIVLLYATATAADTPYLPLLAAVSRVVSVVATGPVLPGGIAGFVTADSIREQVTDYQERLWYVSGPPGLVNQAVRALRQLGVSSARIKTDYFPGLA